MPLREAWVSGIPEGQAAPKLATLAARNRHGVGAPCVEAAPLVRERVGLAALCVLYHYVGSVVGADRQKLAVIQPAPRGLHTADQRDAFVDGQFLSHGRRPL